MSEFLEKYGLILNVGIPLGCIILAWITGRIAENNHNRRLRRREGELSGMLVTDLKSFPGGVVASEGGRLVMGQVVIANDYLKAFLANLRKIFGGEIKNYEKLMLRARREAIVRMLTAADKDGFNAVGNVRLYFTDVGGMSGQRGTAMVEVLACGTAYNRPPETNV